MEIRSATYRFVDAFYPRSFLRRHGVTLEDVQFILMKHNWKADSAVVEINRKMPQLQIIVGSN